MIWQTWLASVAASMGITTAQAGMILSLVITMSVIAVILIASRGKEAGSTIPVMGALLIIFFTFIEWIPLWTGATIALMMSIFIAQKISSVVSG